MRHDTKRWAGASTVVFLAVAVAALTRSPAVLLVAALGVVAGGYATATTAPTPSVSLTRTVDAENPAPGDEVDVHVTLENKGRFVADLRVVDGVPGALHVVDGSPRIATALRAGATASLTYTVEATRGRHEWEPAEFVARDPAGATEATARASDDTNLDCIPPLAGLDGFPLRERATGRVGQLSTNRGGSGTEFYAIRDYRPGDPVNRVDWGRVARTGDLATVDFREERATSVLVVVDTRDEAYAPDADAPSTVERCVTAAGGVVGARLAAGDRVGVASLGSRTTYLAPSAGRDHRARLREALATADGFAPTPAGERTAIYQVATRIRKRVRAGTQVVLCSPVTDDGAPRFARRLTAAGHPVTVVAPEPRRDESGDTRDVAADQIAAAERRLRLGNLRRAGVRTIDWQAGVPLPVAVERARRGWQR